MDKFIIKGPTKLSGTVEISGSKNAALPIMTACLAFPGIYKLKNVPNLRDTRTMIKLLEIIGCVVENSKNTIIIDSRNCKNPEAPYELVKTMRASFYVLGPLLSRFEYAKVSLPGGCAWGPRPIDYHLKAFESLGAEVKLRSGYIITKGKLSSAKVKFPKSSVGATGNVIMACSNLPKTVVIENAAKEPEIVDLCNFLSKIGVQFKGIGTSCLTIKGIKLKQNISIDYSIIPDRIETGTFMIAAAANKGNVKLTNVIPEHLDIIIKSLQKTGSVITTNESSIIIKTNSKINPVSIKTDIYPGFPTDLQAQWIALMITSEGASYVEDTIYIDRFTHVPELIRLGADISMDDNLANIKGSKNIYGTNVMSTDIRASASLIIAAMAAEGTTELSRIYHIDRGYESIEKKLNQLGAKIKRINEPMF